MFIQTPEDLVRNINDMATRLEHDVDRHKPVREILPEIRDMRRLLATLEGDLIEGEPARHGDAC